MTIITSIITLSTSIDNIVIITIVIVVIITIIFVTIIIIIMQSVVNKCTLDAP